MCASRASMSSMPGTTTAPSDAYLVVGLGNDDRGDDAVGLKVARRIRDADLEGAHPRVRRTSAVMEIRDDMTVLIDLWTRFHSTVLVDAVSSDSRPGTIFRFDALAAPLPNIFVGHRTTHNVGVAECIELAQVLGQAPRMVTVYGIEGRTFSLGAPLSQEVESAIEETAKRIMAELQPLSSHSRCGPRNRSTPAPRRTPFGRRRSRHRYGAVMSGIDRCVGKESCETCGVQFTCEGQTRCRQLDLFRNHPIEGPASKQHGE